MFVTVSPRSFCVKHNFNKVTLFTPFRSKGISFTVKMEGHGQNMALFYQIWRLPASHGHLMGENSVHLPALSGQVRMHIKLQSDVGVSVS